LAKTDQGLKIWTEWKLKDAEAGATLFDRIKAVAEAEDQQPELQLSESNIAKAEVFTRSIGGLSINDFIFAAKVDNIKTSDLVKKNKFWA
jgi:4a-hydroxytetrahydrobiopterin dehydratase